MTQSLYVLVLLDEDVRMDSFASTSLFMVVEEAKEAIRAYLDENGDKFLDTPEMAMEGGFAAIHKFQVATRATGEIIWTYSFDGQELLDDAFLPLLSLEDYLSESRTRELSAVIVEVEKSL